MFFSYSAAGEHDHRPAGPGDRRSPCPALNTMANHGYIARDGHNIRFWDVIRGMQECYNLSLPLALFLAIPGYILCGSWLRWTVNLDELALHNRLEHDASLVHADAPAGSDRAPTNVDPTLLHRLLSSCPAGRGLKLEDYAHIRVAREATLPPNKKLDAFHAEVSRGEAALSWLLMKDESGMIPPHRLEQWYGEEKLPDDWKKAKQPLGLITTRKTAVVVKDLITAIRRSRTPEQLPTKQ